MSTLGLSPPAAYVLRSLRDHPDLRLPEAIAAGPASDAAIDLQAVKDGLAELKAKGLAEYEPDHGWRLTDAALGG
jgi:hypothetical protein